MMREMSKLTLRASFLEMVSTKNRKNKKPIGKRSFTVLEGHLLRNNSKWNRRNLLKKEATS